MHRTITQIFFLTLTLAAVASLVAQPVITRHPTNLSVSLGASPSLSVVVDTNSLPVTYQWQKALSALPGETNRTLVLTNVLLSAAGSYAVVVSNAGGSLTSNPAMLTVDPAFTKITAGSVVAEGGHSSGCNWGDYDNDGWVDLFVVRGSVGGTSVNHLFRNGGDGTFARITTGEIATDEGNSFSATWNDYDNDGFLDLFVARSDNQKSAFYRNRGDGTFLSLTDTPFVSQPANTQSGSWGDFDNDGRLDLFVTSRNGAHNALYQNLGSRGFITVNHGPISSLPSSNYRPGLWSDYDNDGDVDLFLCNFGGGGLNYLFRNDGDGVFVSITGDDVLRNSYGSRGAAWADYDNDGDTDLFVANGLGQGSRLFQNNGDGSFTLLPLTSLAGSQANSAYAAWGDYDNDGFVDLFVPNGEVTGENNALYHNNGDGTFTRTDSGSLVNDGGRSVTCGWADYDHDGFLDLFVGNIQAERNFLYRNNGNTNHWLKFKLVGTASNRPGIGAKIRVTANYRDAVRSQLRQVSSGNGHDGGQLIAHFGLGNARSAETVRVEWPSGKVQELQNVPADQFVTVTEPDGDLPLEIRTNPKNQIAGLTETARFYVTVAGAAPVSYQWMRDGQPLPGGTNQVLTLTNVQQAAVGEYSVVVNRAGTSLTSKAARLMIDPFSKVLGPVSEIGGSRGGAWADHDNDGDLDLLVWNGGDVGKVNYLFRNDGHAVFSRITQGVVANDDSDHWTAAWADYDNDGALDLFTAHWDADPNDLFHNNGDGTFVRVGSGSAANDYGGFGGAAWADYDNDGSVDLFFANALGKPHSLYRNSGNGTFVKITAGEIVELGGDSRGAAWSDYDNDGFIDLFVASGDGFNFLFNNLGDGTFTSEARSSVQTVDAMSGSWGDYDNNGLMDLLVVSPGARNILFRNQGNGVFNPVTNPGIANEEIISLGAALGDYDNDGHLDVFIVGVGKNVLFRNTGTGRFTPVLDTQVQVVKGTSFGSSWADFDNDGFLDLFVANGSHERGDANILFRNNANTNRWAKFKLIGSTSNRAGIGAKVRVKARIRGAEVTQMREITGGDGFGNSQPLEAHFGLGDSAVIDRVRIEWPSKKIQELSNVAVNRFYTVTEPGGAPRLSITGSSAELNFTLSGEVGATYRIEGSTDLRNWSLLTTLTVTNSDGTASFTDRPSQAQPTRFYRAVRP